MRIVFRKNFICKYYLSTISHLNLFSAVFFPLKSASAGCSMNANMQNLLQMMQQCGLHSLQKPVQVTERRCLYKPTRTTFQCQAVPCDSEKSISICDNLSELLMAMQDELDQMSM
jgi:hypothetical protein